MLLQDKKATAGQQASCHTFSNWRLGATVPRQNQGKRNEVLSRHHTEAGYLHVCMSVGLGPFQVAYGVALSRRCPPRSTAANIKGRSSHSMVGEPGIDEVSGRRHGS